MQQLQRSENFPSVTQTQHTDQTLIQMCTVKLLDFRKTQALNAKITSDGDVHTGVPGKSNFYGNQEKLQAQLKMCSVKLVDCRKTVESEPEDGAYDHEDSSSDFIPSSESSKSSSDEWDRSEQTIKRKNLRKVTFVKGSFALCRSDEQPGRPVGQRTHECSQCNKRFSRPSNLKRHQSVHTKDKPCGETFSQGSREQTQVSKRVNAGEDCLRCKLCGNQFPSLLSFQRHKCTHAQVKHYECLECGQWFGHYLSLTIHMRIHTGERPYTCSQCDKRFPHISALIVHQRVHTGLKPYHCDLCGKQFSQSTHLRTHQRVHTGVKPYSCSQCGKSFTQSSHLTVHKRLHTGQKPYCCCTCGKGFRTSDHLKLHMRIHTGEKPYRCSVCGWAFTQSHSLKDHLRIHTGELPYQCSKCDKLFREQSLLKHHMKKHLV